MSGSPAVTDRPHTNFTQCKVLLFTNPTPEIAMNSEPIMGYQTVLGSCKEGGGGIHGGTIWQSFRSLALTAKTWEPQYFILTTLIVLQPLSNQVW